MTGMKVNMFSVLLSFLWTPATGEDLVSCDLKKNCTLPCHFQPGDEVVIHWTIENIPVHSYYYNQDQFDHQNQRFRGRTSLFKDQISSGNVSLLLTGVEIQDESRYKCYTRTIKGNQPLQFIHLNVDVPVQKVFTEQSEKRITCSSEGIYPKPWLTWSTRPPTSLVDKSQTIVEQTGQLYNISSSLMLSDNDDNLNYICTVSTRKNSRTATLFKQNTEVSCIFMERCVLPCSYSGTDVVIHWHQVSAGDLLVHSFYHNQDQLADQDQRFRKRTALFQDQISTGNASLQLSGVEVQDEGRYKCYISTHSGGHGAFINLKIHAPVHKVNIQQVGNIITCSSEGIYPKPELTWSTSPLSNMTSNTTTVQQTEQLLYSLSEEQLFSIRGSLILSDSDADVAYSCTISTHRSRKRATLFKSASILRSANETTIPCPPSHHTPASNLVWRFDHRQNIVSRTRADVSYTVHAGWEQHVKNVSESGSLTLQYLTSDHEGIYTCELSDAEDTKISDVMMIDAEKQESDLTLRSTPVGGIIRGILVMAALISLMLIIKCKRNKLGCTHQTQMVQESLLTESHPMTEATRSPDDETSDADQSGSSETQHLPTTIPV